MALSLVGYRQFFNSTVYSVIEKMTDMEADPIFGLYGEQAHSTDTGDTVNFTSNSLSGYAPIVVPGGDIPESQVTQGDALARQYFSIKDRMVVEYESYLHNKLDEVLDRGSDLVEKAMKTAAQVLSGQLLNNAGSTTMSVGSTTLNIACADTLAPSSASHTVPGKVGTTYSNTLASLGALSDVNMDALEQQIKQNNVDDSGTNHPFTADVLIVPDNATMIKKGQQLTMSQLSPETANNAINVYRGSRMDMIVLKEAPRAEDGSYDTTKQYYWALGSKKLIKRAFKFRWAMKPSNVKQGGIVPKFMDKNLDSSIIVFGRIVYGMPRWNGIGYSLSVTKPTTT